MKKNPGNIIEHYSFSLALVILVLLGKTSFAQTKNINNDVLFAKEIRDSIAEPIKFPSNIGTDYWYKFTAEYDTLLFFDIVPYDPKQDYDFRLYKCASGNCVEGIKNKKLNYIRICESVNYDKSGSTGLSPYATQARVGAGPGFGYAATLPIKAGETCYIKVNWPYAPNWQNGFKIYLYNLWPKKPKKLMAKPVVKPKEIVLENVLFETNRSTLLKSSYVALDTLVNQLMLQKTTIIEIKGHTDNTGDEIKNQQLSEKRAKAVFDYLISKNIAPNRLSFRGLGGKEPIATNETEEGRKQNRRVAFAIITK
ncbi:MAG: OmpA family protein [Bacteroidota bacterium]